MKKGKVNIANVKIHIKCISVISNIMSIMLINTIMCLMRIIETYLRERDRRRVMSAAVFPGVVWR
jgi:hypothetical protein